MDARIMILPVQAWSALYFMVVLLYLLASLQQAEEGITDF